MKGNFNIKEDGKTISNLDSKLDENNTFFSETCNTLSFHRNFGDNSFLFSITDRNLAKM